MIGFGGDMARLMATPSPLAGEGGSARSAETDEGCWKKRDDAESTARFGCAPGLDKRYSVQHPSSDLAFGSATFSHKGRRDRGRQLPTLIESAP